MNTVKRSIIEEFFIRQTIDNCISPLHTKNDFGVFLTTARYIAVDRHMPFSNINPCLIINICAYKPWISKTTGWQTDMPFQTLHVYWWKPNDKDLKNILSLNEEDLIYFKMSGDWKGLIARII
jgi:hypothetical protein